MGMPIESGAHFFAFPVTELLSYLSRPSSTLNFSAEDAVFHMMAISDMKRHGDAALGGGVEAVFQFQVRVCPESFFGYRVKHNVIAMNDRALLLQVNLVPLA